MKLIALFLLINSIPAFAETLVEMQSRIMLMRAVQERKAQNNPMTPEEELKEKNLINKYVTYANTKSGSSPIPKYEEFKKDPAKYTGEEFEKTSDKEVNDTARGDSKEVEEKKTSTSTKSIKTTNQ